MARCKDTISMYFLILNRFKTKVLIKTPYFNVVGTGESLNYILLTLNLIKI